MPRIPLREQPLKIQLLCLHLSQLDLNMIEEYKLVY